MRKRSFRYAKYSLRFRLFWALSRRKRNGQVGGRVLGEPQTIGRSVLAPEPKVQIRQSVNSSDGDRLGSRSQKKVAQKSSQAHEIIGVRKLVRAWLGERTLARR